MNPTLIALGYAFCWGVGVTLTKIALSEITPATLLMIQFQENQLPFSWRSLKQGTAGIFEPALAYMVGIFGVEMTTATNAVLIASSEVILTIVCAAIFLGEKLTRMKLGLAGMSFVGVSLLMLKDAAGASQASLSGDLLVLLGTCFAVVYVLLSKEASDRSQSITTNNGSTGSGVDRYRSEF
jgi:drug/metabolite transporter (DMT)-like permease